MKKPWWWHLNPWLACARTGRAYIVALDEMRDLVIRNANLELEVKRLRKDAERYRWLRDDGLYRHIRFRKPGTMCMHFDLVTWPGYLAYSGDMGCYVFTRLADMFEFFRTDRRHRNSVGLVINPGYWSEKLVAVDGNRQNGSATEFNEDKFRHAINRVRLEWIREAAREHQLSREERRELWEAIDEDILDRIDTGGDAAIAAACQFSWPPSWQTVSGAYRNARWRFNDFWEHRFTDYTFHFIWCCYALAWGIKTYDEAKEKEAAHA